MRSKSGFTIIELSVVIAVIAALALLLLVGYGEWRSNLGRAAARSDLAGFASGMENSRTWTEGPSAGYAEFSDNTVFDGTGGTEAVFTQSDSVTVTYKWGSTTMYCVEAVSDAAPSSTYFINTYATGDTVNTGSCPSEPVVMLE